MTAMKGRQATYLDGWRFLIVSDSAVGITAASVLSAIGATVDLRAERAGLPTSGPATQRYDAVIYDRVEAGADPAYDKRVAEWIDVPSDTAGAWVTVSAFGLDGPQSDFRGSNLVVSAAAGLLAAVTDTDGLVHELPGQQGLKMVGQLAALAALHGVSLSRDTGRRIHQDLSAQEGIAYLTIQQDLAHLIYRCGGLGGAARYSAPAGVFACRDGAINMLVIDDHQFARVAGVVGRPDWIDAYPDKPARVEHGDSINEVVQKWAADRSKVECERVLQAAGVSATAVRSIKELADAEQFRSRGWLGPEPTTGVVDILPALVESRDEPRAAPNDGGDRRIRDLRVVEVTNVLAGPLTGAILGGMGADVARLEDVGRLDVYRRQGPFADNIVDRERAAYFLGANNNKRSVAGGVGPENLGFSRRILDWSRVLIENVGTSRLARVGADSYPVGGGNGGISVSISGFGRTGPCADFRGYAPNVHAFAGLEDSAARLAGSRVRLRTALADYCTALWAATLVVAWWLGGRADQERVDLAMSEVVALKLSDVDLSLAESVHDRGDEHVVPLADGRYLAVTFAAGEDEQRVRRVLGATGDVVAAIKAAADEDGERTVRLLQQTGVAAYVVRTVAGVHVDEQLRARAFFFPVEHPIVADAEITALPWKLANSPRSGYRAAPILGADDAWARRMFGSGGDG
jgi:crotonobetainyl-CoA:carnitine CoA-transferase CaiB-like acyl-CoA transferase